MSLFDALHIRAIGLVKVKCIEFVICFDIILYFLRRYSEAPDQGNMNWPRLYLNVILHGNEAGFLLHKILIFFKIIKWTTTFKFD